MFNHSVVVGVWVQLLKLGVLITGFEVLWALSVSPHFNSLRRAQMNFHTELIKFNSFEL